MRASDALTGAPNPDVPNPDVPNPGAAGRDAALAALEAARPEVIAALRAALVALYQERRHQDPWAYVTADDAIPLLEAIGYPGDFRIVGAVLNRHRWVQVGSGPSQLKHRHGRPIGHWASKEE